MTEARLTRKTTFRASHHYARVGWSVRRNREVFGAQVEPHWHDWTLEVRIVGPLDPETGFCVDLPPVERALAELTAGWDGGDLNALVRAVADGHLVPTTESLARWIFQELAPAVAAPARLESVAVFESAELGSEYPAARAAT